MSDLSEKLGARLADIDSQLVAAASTVRRERDVQSTAETVLTKFRKDNEDALAGRASRWIILALAALIPVVIVGDALVARDSWAVVAAAIGLPESEWVLWIGPVVLVSIEAALGLVAAEAHHRGAPRWSALAVTTGLVLAAVVPTLVLAARLAAREDDLLTGIDPHPLDLVAGALAALALGGHIAIVVGGLFADRPLTVVTAFGRVAALDHRIRASKQREDAATAAFVAKFAERTQHDTGPGARGLPESVLALAKEQFGAAPGGSTPPMN